MIYEYKINEMTCEGCQKKVHEALSYFDKAVEVSINPPKAIFHLKKEIPLEDLQRALSQKGPYTIQKITKNSDGSESYSAVATHAVSKDYQKQQLPENIQQLSGKYYCPMLCEGDKVYDSNVGCPVCGMDLVAIGHAEENTEHRLKKLFFSMLIITFPVFIIAMLGMSPDAWIYQFISPKISIIIQILGASIVLFLGRDYIKRAYISFKTKHLNMFSLIGLGAITAYLFSIFVLLFPQYFKIEHHLPIYFESVAVIFTLMVLGQWLEAKTHQKTKASVEYLFDLLPKTVHLISEDTIVDKNISDIKIGDKLLVKVGEKIPADGKILSETAVVNEAFLSGEAMPVEKHTNDEIFAGSINASQNFEMEVTQMGHDTTLAKIVAMVNKASLSRSPIQRLADKISQYFVPIVILISIITFISWWAIMGDYLLGIRYAISVLVIACPCALGLATPVSIAIGIGKAAEFGILIKKAEALELFHKTDVLLTDKTGTITEGKPSIEKIIPLGNLSEKEILYFSASLNHSSEHPLAQAFIKKSKEEGITLKTVKLVATIAGKGIQGVVNQHKVIVGNQDLITQHIDLSETILAEVQQYQNQGKTISFVLINNQLEAIIVLSDALKKDAIATIQFFQNKGIEVVMLTGDSKLTAQAIGKEINIKNIQAKQTPEEKLNYIEQLQKEQKTIAMIGDGINDSPALAKADISLAMGSGAAISQDFSNITIVNNQMKSVKQLYKISHKVVANIKQNLFFAFIYNFVGIIIATGLFYNSFHIELSPMIAALAMSFSSISVLLNALRLKNIR